MRMIRSASGSAPRRACCKLNGSKLKKAQWHNSITGKLNVAGIFCFLVSQTVEPLDSRG